PSDLQMPTTEDTGHQHLRTAVDDAGRDDRHAAEHDRRIHRAVVDEPPAFGHSVQIRSKPSAATRVASSTSRTATFDCSSKSSVVQYLRIISIARPACSSSASRCKKKNSRSSSAMPYLSR